MLYQDLIKLVGRLGDVNEVIVGKESLEYDTFKSMVTVLGMKGKKVEKNISFKFPDDMKLILSFKNDKPIQKRKKSVNQGNVSSKGLLNENQ